VLGTMNPLGERARGQDYRRVVMLFILGSAAGGLLLGLGVGLVGDAIMPSAGSLVVDSLALALLAGAVVGDAVNLRRKGGARIAVSPRRQVSDRWLYRLRGWVYALGFGFQLGLGIVTVVNSYSLYVAIACSFLGGPMAGILIGLTYGAMRGGSLLLGAHVKSSEQVMALGRLLEQTAVRGAVVVLSLECAVLIAMGLIRTQTGG